MSTLSTAELARRTRASSLVRLSVSTTAMFVGYWLEHGIVEEALPGEYRLTPKGERIASGLLASQSLELFGASRFNFSEQDAAQLLKPGRGVVEDEQNHLHLVRLKGERDHASLVGVAESAGELFVLQQAGELEQERRRERDAHQEHAADASRSADGATVADPDVSNQGMAE
jgi:hypothetical protein